jgi:hypothetical protein
MPFSIVLPLYLGTAALSSPTPAQLAAMESLTGEWGFVGWDHPNGAMVRKPGRCGDANVLIISVVEEAQQDGSIEWRLRSRPEDQLGVLVTEVEPTDVGQRITVEAFAPIGHNVFYFEIADDRLTFITGDVHTRYERCAT